jgi:replicative DNA helicase
MVAPDSIEAEQALLGSILMNNSAFHRVAETLHPGHFSNALHAKMFDTIGKLINGGQTANLFSLKTYFDNEPALKAAGGPSYLAKLAGESVHAVDAESFGRLIRETATRRRLIEIANEAMVQAYKPEADRSPSEQIEAFERQLYELAMDHTEGGFAPFAVGLTKSVTSAEGAHKREGALTGVSTGLRALDTILGGLHRSDLVILAARPSMGKTALATNIAVHAAQRYRRDDDGKTTDGASVGFFSLEMSSEQLATRIIADRAGVPSERVRRGQLTSVEFDRVIDASQALQTLPLYIDETPALSISALRTRARRLKRQHGLDLIIVDYLQLLDASAKRDSNRVQEISEISRGLKTLAKELDVPVLALSQLSRAVEQRQDKRPQLSDLRDSGSIEQDADVVMFVYREEYYIERGPEAERYKLADVAGKAEILVSKQRHGPTGIAHLRFDGAVTRFSDEPSAA